MSAYFSHEDLVLLKGLEHKKLARVVYHNWLNKTKPEEPFEFLDKLELKFDDGQIVVLSANEEDEPGIFIVKDFDAEKNKLLLLHQFGGLIDMNSEDLTDNPLWSLVTGKTIRTVELVDDGEESYRNDAVLIDFDGEKMEIHPGMEGLIVEPYDDI
jgi:hypothetical protein